MKAKEEQLKPLEWKGNKELCYFINVVSHLKEEIILITSDTPDSLELCYLTRICFKCN